MVFSFRFPLSLSRSPVQKLHSREMSFRFSPVQTGHVFQSIFSYGILTDPHPNASRQAEHRNPILACRSGDKDESSALLRYTDPALDHDQLLSRISGRDSPRLFVNPQLSSTLHKCECLHVPSPSPSYSS